MAFKMKGFPLQAGTSPAKKYASDAQRKAIYASKAERSAAKQRSADQKTLEELIEEGFTPADARRMQKDKAVTGVETDKKKMQRLEDEAAKANKAGNKEKAKKLIAQVSKLEDKIQGKKDRPEPTYEGTDEFKKEKDIPAKEFEERGVKKPPTKQRKEKPKPPPAPVPKPKRRKRIKKKDAMPTGKLLPGNEMEDRPYPTYEGTDEFRKEKDIPKKEFKKRGVKKPK